MIAKDYYQSLGLVKLKFSIYQKDGKKIKNKYDLIYSEYLKRRNKIKEKYKNQLQNIQKEKLLFQNMSEEEKAETAKVRE